MSNDLQCRVMAAVRVAMLGMVKPNLRCVLVSWNEEHIQLRALYDETFAAEDIEDISVIETELLAQFWPEISVACRAESSSSRRKVIPIAPEVLVYARAEARDYEE